jgi:hypothetical protein
MKVLYAFMKTLKRISEVRKGEIIPKEEHKMLHCEELKEANDSIADKCANWRS